MLFSKRKWIRVIYVCHNIESSRVLGITRQLWSVTSIGSGFTVWYLTPYRARGVIQSYNATKYPRLALEKK